MTVTERRREWEIAEVIEVNQKCIVIHNDYSLQEAELNPKYDMVVGQIWAIKDITFTKDYNSDFWIDSVTAVLLEDSV